MLNLHMLNLRGHPSHEAAKLLLPAWRTHAHTYTCMPLPPTCPWCVTHRTSPSRQGYRPCESNIGPISLLPSQGSLDKSLYCSVPLFSV